MKTSRRRPQTGGEARSSTSKCVGVKCIFYSVRKGLQICFDHKLLQKFFENARQLSSRADLCFRMREQVNIKVKPFRDTTLSMGKWSDDKTSSILLPCFFEPTNHLAKTKTISLKGQLATDKPCVAYTVEISNSFWLFPVSRVPNSLRLCCLSNLIHNLCIYESQ